MRKKNSLLLYIVLIATAFLVVLRLLSTSSLPSRANQAKINILMVPKTGILNNGEQKVVTIILQPADAGNKITGFDFNLATLGNMQIQDISEPLNLDTNDSSIFTKLVKEINPTSGRMSYVILQPDTNLPTRVQIQVTVTAAQSQYTNGILRLDGNTAQFVGNITGNMYTIGQIEQAEFILGGDITPTIYVTSPTPTGGVVSPTTGPSATPLPSGFPTLTPTRIPTVTSTPRPGTPTPTSVFGTSTTPGQRTPTPVSSCAKIASPVQPKPFGLFTPGQTTLSWQAVPGAQKYAIRIDDIGNGWLGYFELTGDLVDDNVMTNTYTYSFESGHAYRWWVHAINACGRWSAPLESYVYIPPTAPTYQRGTPTPTGGIGNVPTATPLPPGFPTLTPTPIGFVSPTPTLTQNIPTVTPTRPPSPTPSPASVDMSVNLKLKFQGAVKTAKAPYNKIKVNFVVFSNGKVVAKPSVDFTADSTGILLGRISFKAPANEYYGISVDTDKHLRRVICASKPVESNPHSYTCTQETISLQKGDQNLDFTGVTIFAGDVQGVGNYPADGVIDSADLTFIAQRFGNKNANNQDDSDTINKYDLNFDGHVDTQDYSLAIFSMLIQRTDDTKQWTE